MREIDLESENISRAIDISSSSHRSLFHRLSSPRPLHVTPHSHTHAPSIAIMGVAPSQSMESLSDNVCIAALVSRSPVTREALWNELFDSFEYPSCCLSPAHLEFLTKMGDIFRTYR